MAEFTAHDTEELLRRLSPEITQRIVVVGGQALNFWAELYLSRAGELNDGAGPYTSKDMDFLGDRSDAEACALALGGKVFPEDPGKRRE